MRRKSPKTLAGGNRQPLAISLKTGSTPAAPSISKALPSVTRTMAEGSGTSQTQAQADENRQDKPFFGAALLLRLQIENAYSCICWLEVHNSDKSSSHSHVKVDIYITAVGMIDIPTEKEILATMEEIRNNPKDFKFVA